MQEVPSLTWERNRRPLCDVTKGGFPQNCVFSHTLCAKQDGVTDYSEAFIEEM